MLRGIDLSNYQRSNYKFLIDSYGHDFVICRAAWRYNVDPMCDVMYQYAKSKGKKLGVYFFPLTSDGSPEKHAEWAYNQVLGYIGEAIFALDWESYGGSEGNNAINDVSWAKRWLDKFYELSGVRPMIYMNSNLNRTVNFTSIFQGNYGLWIANYGKNNGLDYGRPPVNYWKSAAIHQFTSLGDNFKSLDRDTFYGDKAAWDAYAKSNKSVKPTEPISKTYTQSEVDQIIKSEQAKYQQQIDQALEASRIAEQKLGTCETVVKDAKKGIEGVLNYGK